MAKRGRPKKSKPLGEIKLLEDSIKSLQKNRCTDLEKLYKDLAELKLLMDNALTRLGHIDGAKEFSEAVFNAGKAFVDVDKANDKLYNMLEDIYERNEFEHWDDVLDNY